MNIDDLEAAGYSVGEAFRREDGANVYAVAGYGVQTYVTEGDTQVIESLVAHSQEQAS